MERNEAERKDLADAVKDAYRIATEGLAESGLAGDADEEYIYHHIAFEAVIKWILAPCP